MICHTGYFLCPEWTRLSKPFFSVVSSSLFSRSSTIYELQREKLYKKQSNLAPIAPTHSYLYLRSEFCTSQFLISLAHIQNETAMLAVSVFNSSDDFLLPTFNVGKSDWNYSKEPQRCFVFSPHLFDIHDFPCRIVSSSVLPSMLLAPSYSTLDKVRPLISDVKYTYQTWMNPWMNLIFDEPRHTIDNILRSTPFYQGAFQTSPSSLTFPSTSATLPIERQSFMVEAVEVSWSMRRHRCKFRAWPGMIDKCRYDRQETRSTLSVLLLFLQPWFICNHWGGTRSASSSSACKQPSRTSIQYS